MIEIPIIFQTSDRVEIRDVNITISNVVEADRGWYVCVVKTSDQRMESKRAFLQVLNNGE
jgi:hypothetical protein